jgi:hypothetical protein
MCFIRTKWQMWRLKTGFQLRFPYLMGNIIKILLYKNEEALACYLTAFYEIYIDKTMLEKAIMNDHYVWLNYLWVFKKNKILEKPDEKDKRSGIKLTIVKFDDLFLMIESLTKNKTT